MNEKNNSGIFLGLGAVAMAIALLFVRVLVPEILWATLAVGAALATLMAVIILKNINSFKGRTAAFGLNSLITVLLVLGILSVINYVAVLYPKKLDLTRNKANTLSEQTISLVKHLQQPLHATLFIKFAQKDQYKVLLDNYKALNTKFEVEIVDPDREPTRTKAASVKKLGTMILGYAGREGRVEEFTEEKLTNALIKLTKDKTPTLCAIIGHGEKSFAGNEAEGYSSVKKGLNNQSYEEKDINLLQEQKIPNTCDAIAIMGPTTGFMSAEIKVISDYLAGGGRGIFANDVNIKGQPFAPELDAVLAQWNVKSVQALIVDPNSRLLGADATVPLVFTFSKESPITKEFPATPDPFPIAHPLQVTQATAGLTVLSLGKTSADSFSIDDFKALSKGQLKIDPKFATHGPFDIAVSVEGKSKDSKAEKKTRVVVFGSSIFATNNFARYGVNQDFVLNAIAWILEDESMISIRPKDDEKAKLEMSRQTGSLIFLVAVILVPLVISVAGVVIWLLRRRL